MNFLFFQSLAVLDIQDTPGLPLLSAMRSHLCLTVPHTCCPSSHNLTPSLLSSVQGTPAFCQERAFTLLLTVLSIMRRSMLFPPRRSWTATLRTGWASSYSNFITRGQNQKGSVYTGALSVSSYCCSIYNNKELEPDLMPVRRQMGNENEEERVSEEEREQQDHELLKQKGELGSEGEVTLPKHTLLK